MLKLFSKNLLACIILMLMPALATPASAASEYDLARPFGFATRSSRTDATATYTVTGGGAFTYPVTGVTSVTTLTSNGGDMRTAIQNAIKNYAVVILDGSKGDFTISSSISLSSLKNKTVIGINNARLCTKWYVTQEMKDALDAAGVKGMSTSSGGGTLPNGKTVKEAQEYYTRLTLIELTGDTNESYTNAGVFKWSKCSNCIIRNIKFVGPGAVDIGGADLNSFTGCTNMWVDHCEFTDGTDGNFDITQASDFVTVSWCVFRYTGRSYSHQNTNLVGSSDSETAGKLNITFAYNHWGENCRARMPMGRRGKIHMLNNYYTCAGNGTACINPRITSEFLIEGNYFDEGVEKVFSQSGATAYVWKSNNIIATTGVGAPSSKGGVTMPYTYTVMDAANVPAEVGTYAGATLFINGETETPAPEDEPVTPENPDEGGEETPDEGGDSEGDILPPAREGNKYIVTAEEGTPTDNKKIVCQDIIMTYGADGSWQAPLADATAPEGYSHFVVGANNPKDDNGSQYSTSKQNPPTTGTFYMFTPAKDGTLRIAVNIYTGKKLYVTENGAAMTVDADGIEAAPGFVLSTSEPKAVTITLPVKAGSNYHAFCLGSKIKLYGFEFVTEDDTAAVIPGDVNGDGQVTIADANTVVNHYLNTATVENEAAADVNGDGQITIADANQIVNMFLGQE